MSALAFLALISSITTNGGEQSRKPAPAGDSVEMIKVTRLGQGWFLDFYPDGRVHAQFGATFGDSGSVPAGTVAFEALLAAVRRLRVQNRVNEGTQVAIRLKGETNAKSFNISDDTLFRYLVASFRDKWRQEPGGSRFQELLKSQPIFPEDEGR